MSKMDHFSVVNSFSLQSSKERIANLPIVNCTLLVQSDEQKHFVEKHFNIFSTEPFLYLFFIEAVFISPLALI